MSVRLAQSELYAYMKKYVSELIVFIYKQNITPTTFVEDCRLSLSIGLPELLFLWVLLQLQ